MELYDDDFEIPGGLTCEQCKVAVLTIWPDATFYEDEGTEQRGPMLIAYRNADAERSWDAEGRTDDNAHDAVMFLWPLDGGAWVTCDGPDHEVLKALGIDTSTPNPDEAIRITTTVKTASGRLVSTKVVDEPIDTPDD
jgi:hypothetical protein